MVVWRLEQQLVSEFLSVEDVELIVHVELELSKIAEQLEQPMKFDWLATKAEFSLGRGDTPLYLPVSSVALVVLHSYVDYLRRL